MGRYRPPSGETLQKPHPLGSRASKLASHGILVVRFEMPFAIWCAHCPTPTLIGQGVRFNAEKKKVGNYHTTPVWAFTIKHNVCGGVIEMRTDPKNSEYTVVSGARRRDYGADGESLVSGGVVVTDRERAEHRESAFGKLEKTIADREQVAGATARIGELQDEADRRWEDPYALNRRLRKAFRVGRHAREREAGKDEEVRERMGLGIELLPETEEDARRAGLVDFGGVDVEGDVGAERALARPLFGSGEGEKEKEDGRSAKGKGKPRAEMTALRTREKLASQIVANTRAAKDPFLDFGSRESTPRGPVRLAGLKRKRGAEEASDPPTPTTEQKDTPKPAAGPVALVNYDSDSE